MATHPIQQKKYTTTLYSVVFDSYAVRVCVALLFCFLLLQPVALAFASEDTAPSAPSEAVAEPEPASEQVEAPTEESEEQVAEETIAEEVTSEPEVATEGGEEAQTPADAVSDAAVIEEESGSPVAEESQQQESNEQSTADAQDDSGSVQTGGGSSASSATTSPSEPADSDEPTEDPNPSEEIVDATTTPTAETPVVENQQTNEEETETPPEEEIVTATTTEATTTENTVYVDHNASAYEFNTKECASVGDGAFYCSTVADADEFKEDGVFAAPDADGDLEIFVRLDGEESQLTHNTIDDSAPYYDAVSERIVWHAVYHDRYQIVSFDVDSGEATVMTDTNYNNMEPVAYGDITLWQAWINNNWEIMMHDGKIVKKLTHNTMHDVSPHMRGEYVVWQTQFADGWQVAVYDQETGSIEYVRSEGGAKVENPRFVLVYDSTNEAGDVQTIGYDFDNKRSFTLNSIPAELPDELPEPDQTGETRALIQNKHTPKNSELEELEPQPQDSNASTSPQSDGLPTLDLTASSTPQAQASSSPALPVEDLVIPQATTTAETVDISHIPDVVIPPDTGTSTTEVR